MIYCTADHCLSEGAPPWIARLWREDRSPPPWSFGSLPWRISYPQGCCAQQRANYLLSEYVFWMFTPKASGLYQVYAKLSVKFLFLVFMPPYLDVAGEFLFFAVCSVRLKSLRW